MSDFNTNDTLVEMFLFETSQLLEQLEQVILSSDSSNYYSEENINEVFRIMHTIKGSSAMMSYKSIFDISHAVEDLFFYIREENPKQDYCSSLNDLILNCIDFIKIELEKIKNRDNVDGDSGELVDRIKAFLFNLKNNKFVFLDNNDKEEINTFKAVIHFENGCEMENIRAFSVVHNLKDITDELIYYPQDIVDNNESVDIIRRDGFSIYMKTYRPQNEIYDNLMQTVFLKKLELETIDEKTFEDFKINLLNEQIKKNNEIESKEENISLKEENISLSDNENTQLNKEQLNNEKEPTKNELQTTSSVQSIISVSVSKLDKLMDLVGELVIAEAMVLQNPDLEGLKLDNFQKSARQLSKITSELQDLVMSVRMVPLSATFHRMHRIVRDMCRKLNKDVHLEIIGEETEVDKNVIERITDPLMHLVRNAVDHGIETADERIQMGKPKQGTLTLEAKNVGSDVHIIVKDDGKGLNKEKILKKAQENGLITGEENLNDSEIYKLILLPGFSTKENVTEYSGRGVGMDVVANNLESIGGSILIESEENKGTQITLKIPLTLAIIDGMNLKVGNSTFTIPTLSIQESFRVNKKDVITDPNGNEMILVRGECYPILRLHEYFNVKTNITDLSEGIITMVSQDGKNICVFADRLLSKQQVVVKSLPKYLKRFKSVKGISGCTLLGDGSISLILDIASIINEK